MKILLGVTGCIAAYKACGLIGLLRQNKHEVRVIMTKNAMQFITPLTLATLSGHEVMHDMWQERKGVVEHIDVAKWADILVVYPATANIIGKFANGIADDLLSTVYLAMPSPKKRIICPAMNTNMWFDPAVERNVSNLAEYTGFGDKIVYPVEGRLACGDTAMGKLAPAIHVLTAIEDISQQYFP